MSVSSAFESYFRKELDKSKILKTIIYEIFVVGTAYIIGGYFRDFLLDNLSRDIDILTDISHDYLVELLNNNNIDYAINRHNGIKIRLEEKELDIWTFENNWAFKNKLVNIREDNTLHRIVKGCFYNYDALAINLHNFNYNLRYFKQFQETRVLDLLYYSVDYMILNKTIEANILRAFYIKELYGAIFSNKLNKYLQSKVSEMKDAGLDPFLVLIDFLAKYPKYKTILTPQVLRSNLLELQSNDEQLTLEF